jgi:hypothetical protein
MKIAAADELRHGDDVSRRRGVWIKNLFGDGFEKSERRKNLGENIQNLKSKQKTSRHSPTPPRK